MAVNSLASSTNTVEKSSMTAKGTILIGNGTEPTALTVGANGKALFADSTNSQGVSWSDVPVSYVTDEAFIGSAGTQSVTVNIPAGTYLAKLSPNTSISIGGQSASQSSIMTFANAQTSVSITGTIPTATGEYVPNIWTTVSSGFGGSLTSVAYGNGLWIATGYYFSGSAPILTSTNAITWTSISSNQHNIYKSILSVEYGNSKWVVGARDGKMASSTNGSSWVTVNSGFSGNSGHVGTIKYGNGSWLAGSQDGEIRSASDSDIFSWTLRTSNFGTSVIRKIEYGNGIWVAAGDYGQIRRSTDTITWNTVTSNFANQSIRSVSYGNGLWVAMTTPNGWLRTSTDGATWITQANAIVTLTMAFGANNVWSIGSHFSTNGTTWTAATQYNLSNPTSINYGNGEWVVVGTSGQMRKSSVSVYPTTFHSIFYKNPTTAS